MRYHNDRVELTHAAVDALFADRVATGLTPSTLYAVLDHGVIRYAGGFGDQGDGRAPGVDTAFRIASCTKSFTAAALLIMVERGAVGLDDPVDTYLTIGPMIGPDQRPVRPPTLRELVSMAGGLPTDDPWADRQESLTADAFAAVIADGIRFTAEPGERYEYSNLGFALLGAVIEKVSGRRYVDLVTEDLIGPLGISGVGYDRSVSAPGGIADGFARFDEDWQLQPFSEPGAFSPIGGVVATAAGLARWIGWLAAAFTDTDDHDQPLGRLSRRLMQTAATPIPGGSLNQQAYGMGLMVEDNARHGTIVGHSGGYPGFGAHMRWHPESGIGVVALENARYSAPRGPVTSALDLILDETCAPASLPPLWPETIAARDAVDTLIRRSGSEPASAEDLAAGLAPLLADNVDLDEPLLRRATTIIELAAAVRPDPGTVPLIEAAPVSDTPAQLAWTIAGSNGSLRCRITLTPTARPLVQTLTVRPG